MSDDIKELKSDVKEVRKDIGDIKVLLASNTVSLDAHIKRTAINEERVSRLEYWLLGLLAAILLAIIASVIKPL